jgi:hypothetical protein
MTDRYHSITVVLENNTRDDDAEGIIHALKMIKGVIEVKGNVVDSTLFTAESRIRIELLGELLKVAKGTN